jgi:hypothetical protein
MTGGACAATVERAAVRRVWDVPEDAPVVLFCAKLQSWKRPQDLLRYLWHPTSARRTYSKRGLLAPDRLRTLGEAARRMQSWAPVDDMNAVARAVAMACALKEDSGQENL